MILNYSLACDIAELTHLINQGGYSVNRLLGVFCDTIAAQTNITVPDDLTDDERAIIDAAVAAYDPLPIAKAALTARLHDMCEEYIYAHYDNARQASLNALLTEALMMSYPNRMMYIGQALAWIKACIAYYYTISDQIDAAASVEVVNGITWDFSQFDATDPQITLRDASNMTT